MSRSPSTPGWKRLWWHSLRLAARWALNIARHRGSGARVAAQRALVPLDPWRYYELGMLADQRYEGRCLDVSSPKLLTSLMIERRSTLPDLGGRDDGVVYLRLRKPA